MAKVKHFPHYINARNDRKIKKGRLQLGIEFYAIYWMLLEVLSEEADFKYPLDDIDILADDFGTSLQKIQVVVLNYGLFNVDPNEKFFSVAQVKALQPYLDKIEMYSLMGKKSGIARKKKALQQIEELEQPNEPKLNLGSTQVKTEVEQLTNYTNKLTNKHTHTIDNWIEEYCTNKPPAYKADMRKRMNAKDPVALKTFTEWKQKKIHRAIKDEEKNRIYNFDYQSLVGLTIGDKVIKYISTEKNSNYLHINFLDGSSDTNVIKKDLYEWYQLKLEETAC